MPESSQESTLSRLMAGYQAGDAASFDALHSALAPGLRRYLSALTRDAGRAEDLLQETFLRMHKVVTPMTRRVPSSPGPSRSRVTSS